MEENHRADHKPPHRGDRSSLLLSLWPIAIAVAFGLAAGPWVMPKVSATSPRISTIISIGSGSVQIRFNLNFN